jgi:predicted phage terminase large subunit-like protein
MATNFSHGQWKPAKHLLAVDRHIVRAVHGYGPRLIVIEAPPRHGKSEYISKWLVAWFLATFPRKRAVITSHEADFAKSWGRKVREVISEHSSAFGIKVCDDKAGAGDWEIDHFGGGLFTAGVCGSLTGRGADLLVIDDVIKNSEEALSPTVHDRHWDWFQSVASTRLEPGGLMIVMMTRWHAEDLSGRLLAEAAAGNGTPVYRIHLPAIAEEHDWMGRLPGEALWSARWPLQTLIARKAALSDYWWDAMFQQRPMQHGSFEWPAEYFGPHLWCHREDFPERFQLGAIAVDPSKGKDAKKGDYSGIGFAGLSDGHIWVDATLRRRPVEQIVSDGIDHAVKFAQSLHGFAVETNQFQELLVGEFERQTKERRLMPLPLMMVNNTVNKKLRIGRLGPYFSRRKIKLLDTPDNRLLIEQCKSFTMRDVAGIHDDGPDMLEMAIRTLIELQGGTVTDDAFSTPLV